MILQWVAATFLECSWCMRLPKDAATCQAEEIEQWMKAHQWGGPPTTTKGSNRKFDKDSIRTHVVIWHLTENQE